jgi:hypothetical protein
VVAHGVVHEPAGQDSVVLLKDLAGGIRRGGDHRGDRAQTEGHERTVSLGKAGEGAVRLVADEVETADEWKREGSRWEAAAYVD